MQSPESSNPSTLLPTLDTLVFNALPGNHVLLVADAPKFTIAAVSDDYLNALGMQRNRLIGSGVVEAFFDGNDQDKQIAKVDLFHSLTKVLETKQADQMGPQSYPRINLQTGQIQLRYWQPANRPILDSQNQVGYIIHSTEDITDSLQLIEIGKQREYFQVILNLCKEPVQVLEPVFENGQNDGTIVDFRFVLTNQAYASYANTTPKELEGKRVGEVFPGYFDTDSFKNPVETYKTGHSLTFEIHYDKDGLDLYNLMSTFKLDNRVLIHFTDFTDLKHLQIQLESKIEQLKHSNQRLEDFAYAASHDLKEPVRKIQSFSKLLKSTLGEKMSESETVLFDRMLAATLRMNTLIESLLTYSQLDQQILVVETVPLNEVVSRVLGDLDFEIEDTKARIEVGPLCVIKGYHRQWEQAFQNLISNALKYAKASSAPHIVITCSNLAGTEVPIPLSEADKRKEFHLIQVRDNGIGFAQEDAERIFNMFTRLHGVTEYKGSGIGLSTVKKIVANHQGYIWAESKPTEGSCFFILLPKE